ncbi:cytochrome b561 / ferric reductase transmembrane domain-containing protein [Tieghemostelium lacteum]|uniref:Cytochrome b561 / ferric reductase transmembrane domain-containing protein n=1 Tax=Tieghemostelium lacteum TaxID=361077 RepID=A0A152A9F6_TIELA|nr:cytochrome b561 / ferric reductase transmembrane domain-containing protein [Tieghemostelium lacteum]|eukprot:KYR02862.1 cytochrome b561 / ferric reductase transmembrane domain-containing protein [Tieghemostelium lacteum]
MIKIFSYFIVILNFGKLILAKEEEEEWDFVGSHGSLMFLSFGIMIPIGIFISRYLKIYKWWFPIHIFLQSSALAFMLTGYIIMLTKIGFTLETNHAKVGFATILLMVITYVGGIISHLFYDPKRKSAPIFPDRLHWYSGRLIYLLSQVTLILGMRFVFAKEIIIIYSFCILIFLCVPLIIELFIFQKTKHRKSRTRKDIQEEEHQ